jgi:hypothetical protein
MNITIWSFKLKNILTLLILIVVSACCKNKKENFEITITGITERDIFSTPVGNIDTDDWTNDASFAEGINAKFNFTDAIDYTGAMAGTINFVSFPNPTTSINNIIINNSTKCALKVIVVDANLNVKQQYGTKLSSGSNTVALNFGDASFATNTNYRVYYQFYDSAKNVFFKGHGDVRKM